MACAKRWRMACRVRLRPVLMTSLATIIGLLPMALKLGAGSEAYAPLARAILGGLTRLGRCSPCSWCRRLMCWFMSQGTSELQVVLRLRSSVRFALGTARRMAQQTMHLTLAEARKAGHPEQSAVHARPSSPPRRPTRFPSSTTPASSRPSIGSFTGVGADTGSRLAAGGLNNPVVYNRLGSGFRSAS